MLDSSPSHARGRAPRSQRFALALLASGMLSLSAASDPALASPADDQVAPVTTADAVPAAYRRAPVQVSLYAEDEVDGSGVDATYYTILPGGQQQTYADEPIELGNGQSLSYYSVDAAGNAESPHTTGTAKVDTVKPTATATPSAPLADWSKTPIEITLAGADATSSGASGVSGVSKVTYEIVSAAHGAGPTVTYSAATPPQLGNKETLTYRARDKAGNIGVDQTTDAAHVDTTAPVTTSDAPSGYQDGPYDVALAATDEKDGEEQSGVATTTYSVNGGAPTPYTDPVHLESGDVLAYSSTDSVGNVESTHTLGGAQVDVTKPTTMDDVPAGWQSAPVTVHLSASDAGESGVASTDWTTYDSDGEELTSGTVGDGTAITLGNGDYVKYFSTDNVGNVEDINTSPAAKVDTTDPTTTDDVPATWQDGPITVTLTASDKVDGVTQSGVSATAWTINDSDGAELDFGTVGDGKAITLGNGDYVKYFSTDDVGNVETLRTSPAAKVDTTAPSTTDDVPAAWQDGPVTVTLTASDKVGGVTQSGVASTDWTTYDSDDAELDSGTAADPITLGNGDYVKYFSTDDVGNVESVQTSSAAKVDTTAPSTSDDVPAAWQDGPVTVTLTASDEVGGVTQSGVASTDWTTYDSADEELTSGTVGDGTAITLNNGDYVKYFSTDDVGNAETVRTSLAAQVDTTAPTTTASTVPSTWQKAPVKVTFTADDKDAAGDEQSGVDTTTWTTYDSDDAETDTGTVDADTELSLGNGDYVKYFSTDKVGNVETTQTTASAMVDETNPVVSYSPAPLPATYSKVKVPVTLHASDDEGLSTLATSTYDIVKGAATVSSGTAFIDGKVVDLSDGQMVVVHAADVAGNTASTTSEAAKVDGVKPVSTDNVPAGYAKTATVPVTLSATDLVPAGDTVNGSSGPDMIVFQVLAADGTPYDDPATYDSSDKPELKVGERITYKATDHAGNKESFHTSAALKVDTIVPVTTASAVPTSYGNSPVQVTLSPTDAGGSGLASTTYEVYPFVAPPQDIVTQLNCYFNHICPPTSPTTVTYHSGDKITLNDGQYAVYRSTDGAGNVEADHQTAAAKVDTAPPVTAATVDVADLSEWTDEPVEVTLGATDDKSGVATTKYEILADGATFDAANLVDYDDEDRPTLADGESIAFRSTDGAENTETTKTVGPAKVDSLAPVTTATPSEPIASATGPVTVTLSADDTQSGIDSTEFAVVADGDTYDPADLDYYDSQEPPVLEDGETIYFRSTDNVGRVETTKSLGPVHVTVPVTTPPATTPEATTPEATTPDPTTPIATTPEATTPPATTPAATTPVVTTPAATTPPVTTPPVTTPPVTTPPLTTPVASTPVVTTPKVTTPPVTTPAPVIDTPAPVVDTPAPVVETPAAPAAAAPAAPAAPVVKTAPPATTPSPGVSVANVKVALKTDAKGRDIVVSKKLVRTTIKCGKAACRFSVQTTFYAKGKTVVDLGTKTLYLTGGKSQALAFRTSPSELRVIAKMIGKKGTGGELRFLVTPVDTAGKATGDANLIRKGLRLAVIQ